MITLIVENGEDGSILQRRERLTIRELGTVLVELGKEYSSMSFDTVTDVNTQVGFTLYIVVIRRGRY